MQKLITQVDFWRIALTMWRRLPVIDLLEQGYLLVAVHKVTIVIQIGYVIGHGTQARLGNKLDVVPVTSKIQDWSKLTRTNNVLLCGISQDCRLFVKTEDRVLVMDYDQFPDFIREYADGEIKVAKLADGRRSARKRGRPRSVHSVEREGTVESTPATERQS